MHSTHVLNWPEMCIWKKTTYASDYFISIEFVKISVIFRLEYSVYAVIRRCTHVKSMQGMELYFPAFYDEAGSDVHS